MNTRNRTPLSRAILVILIVPTLVGGFLAYRWWDRGGGQRAVQVWAFFQNPESQASAMIHAGERCAEAPFLMPTNGLIGFLWGDSFRPGHTHQGIDIFGGQQPGMVPVFAAYPGYLTRLPDWKSTVIIRIPDDPLQPGRQIWTYYTHMADKAGNSFIAPAFPPGTSETFVEAGTFLGYQGDFSGDPGNPTGVHLHLSIVKDDGQGNFTNELEIRNTYDPSPYLGLRLNAQTNQDSIPVCETL
jgi:murein DD-endopeptidase MepM/ murein hydrolase activator NlpD